MPTLTVTPIALPQGQELELSNQEFELDIRISAAKIPMPTSNFTPTEDKGCSGYTCACYSYENDCTGTALTCNRPYC